jgi:hypothetical protein
MYVLSVFQHDAQRLVHVVGADFGERSCPKDTELRNENPQLAYHRTPPCNMYRVELNPPSRVTLSKLPDSFYTPRLFTTKISDYEKEIGFYYR